MYKGQDIIFTIAGQSISCLASFTYDEVTDLKYSAGPDLAWTEKRGSLQGFKIELAGFDQGAWALFRSLRGQVFTITLQTPDLVINEQVEGIIQSMGRNHAPDDAFPVFSCTIQGHKIIVNLGDQNYLLQESGDLILQESGDGILL